MICWKSWSTVTWKGKTPNLKLNSLGKTGLIVSRLCFGTLTVGPLQADLSPEEGGRLIAAALEAGVNFIDTAEIYGTYPHIARALQRTGLEAIIATKSYAYTAEMMAASVERARSQMNRDLIDVFLLHEQESILTLKGHAPALEHLHREKAMGRVKAVGISTHSVDCVYAAADFGGVEVIHPLINVRGIGIRGGGAEEMLNAIRYARRKGIGVYGMKPLGGGTLYREAVPALAFAFGLPELDAVAVGMQTEDELKVNLALARGENPEVEALVKAKGRKRRLHIEKWCQGCGNCVEACPQEALSLGEEGKVVLNADRCILCGYCVAACAEFCLKVI